MRGDRSKRLTVLSETEKATLYGLPHFDDFQRTEFFAMTKAERDLAFQRQSLTAQLFCLLQIGYFKAKQAFFRFSLKEVPPEDISFLLLRYCPGQAPAKRSLHRKEYYAQRKEIADLFGYRLWSDGDLPILLEKATMLARTDVAATFLLTELMAFLNGRRIVRPGYTTLQSIISDALSSERQRLEQRIDDSLDEAAKTALQKLLVREGTLSELASIKQDAKHFRYRMMALERQKRAILAPLYRIAKAMLPSLDISQLNIAYYASLANYYTIYDMRRLKPGQTYLYLLCYAWQRYRQLSDNLVEAFGYHMKKLEDETKESANKQVVQSQTEQKKGAPQVGQVLLLYVDDELEDDLPFGSVRSRAFRIMPRETLLAAGKRLSEKPISQLELRWLAVDKQAGRCTKNLRPLAMALDFGSSTANSPWLEALRRMKKTFGRQQRLVQRPIDEIPENTVPDRLRPYLLNFGPDGEPTGLRGDRYEFWVYRQLRQHLDGGGIYVDDSVQHRSFADELVSLEQKAEALKELDIPWFRQPIDVTLDALFAELDTQWQSFGRELRQGKLKHLEFDPIKKSLTWRRRLFAAGQSRRLANRTVGSEPARELLGLRYLLQQHFGHRADHDHGRHAYHEQSELRHHGLVRHGPRSAFHQPAGPAEPLWCGRRREDYASFLIQPVGQIDRELIVSEKDNIDRIVATLGLKEITQSTLVRKLCTLSGHHRTRKAIFEYDKLIRSIYTLRYLRDPQLQRNVHCSQNRIESYHQLRSVIAQISGRKELIGRTDLDIAISNQCGRLVANVVIAYNSILLSGLLNRYQAEGNQKAIDLLRRISPVAWQNVRFLGHYSFREKSIIDMEALLASVSVL